MPFPFAASSPTLVWGEDVVNVEMIRGGGDARPRVEAVLDENDDAVLAVIDLAGDSVRIGSLLAARSGIEVRYRDAVAEIPQIRINELVINNVTAEVVSGEDLVIGAYALPDVLVSLSASSGQVRLAKEAIALGITDLDECVPIDAPRSARWRERGTLIVGDVHGALDVGLTLSSDGEPRTVLLRARLRTDLAASVLAPEPLGDPPERREHGEPGIDAELAIGALRLPERFFPWDESIADPRPEIVGEIGADVLASLDVTLDRASSCLYIRSPRAVKWTDASALRRERAEADAAGIPLPEPGPGDAISRARWSVLALLRWETGDIEGALAADRILAGIAGDRCELWQAIGTRSLRAGNPDAAGAFARVDAVNAEWIAAGRAVRSRVRQGRPPPGAPPEPSAACQGSPEPLPATEGALRAALASGRGESAVRAALARVVYDQGRLAPALAALYGDMGRDPHPLTTAITLRPLLESGVIDLEEAPCCSVSGALVQLAAGMPEDPSLAARLEELRVEHPGDPSVSCQIALYDALQGPAEIPKHPEADCIAAGALLAASEGRLAMARQLEDELVARWPDLVSARGVDDPKRDVVRRVDRP